MIYKVSVKRDLTKDGWGSTVIGKEIILHVKEIISKVLVAGNLRWMDFVMFRQTDSWVR